jgi:hypothetical protein
MEWGEIGILLGIIITIIGLMIFEAVYDHADRRHGDD